MNGYFDAPIPYTEGHKCEANGVGDYQMVCADGTVLDGFVPFMLRTLQKGNCQNCGKFVEAEDG